MDSIADVTRLAVSVLGPSNGRILEAGEELKASVDRVMDMTSAQPSNLGSTSELYSRLRPKWADVERHLQTIRRRVRPGSPGEAVFLLLEARVLDVKATLRRGA